MSIAEHIMRVLPVLIVLGMFIFLIIKHKRYTKELKKELFEIYKLALENKDHPNSDLAIERIESMFINNFNERLYYDEFLDKEQNNN